MKNLIKKKKRTERFFSLSLIMLTLSLCFLFITMLDVVYNYYPGCDEQNQMIRKGIITFSSSALFGYLTAKYLHKYSAIIKIIDLYKKGQKNKMNEMEEL